MRWHHTMRVRPAWLQSLGPLVMADLRRRYAGSFLGALWALLAPLLEAGCYAAVFGWLLSAGGAPGLPYGVLIASGLFPWIAFREGLEGCASVLPDNRWVRRSRVPIELLVARVVTASLVRAVVGLLLVFAFAAATGRKPGPGGWISPLLALGLQAVATYGLGLLVAPTATILPDLRPTLTWLLTLLTFASSILYPEAMAAGAVKSILTYNPFTYLLRLYRSPLLPADGPLLLVSAGVAFGVAVVALVAGRLTCARLWWKARDLL
jgi:ABC-type polysaccharide/polyol phosphate export permease